MTSTRERQKDPAPGTGTPPWAERSLFHTVRGVPVWGSIGIAVALTAIGTIADQLMSSGPGVVTMVCYFLGCVAAIVLARRSDLFGPMVQAPLVITLVLPVIVLVMGGGSGTGGMSGLLLNIANPLISSFPVMAGTTAVTVGIGLTRMYYVQRADAADDNAGSAAQVTKNSQRASAEREKSTGSRPKRPESRRGERAEAERKRPSQAKSGGESRTSSRRGREGSTGEARRDKESGSGRQRSAPGRGGRQAPGRGRPPESRPGGEPPRRPRRPRGDSFE